MKMKKCNFILCCCSLFLLVSCAKEKQVELVFEEFPIVETLNPVEFKTEAPILSPMGMCVSGGNLILAQSVKDSIVTAFPLPLGERYSCFGKTGNGPDDFATYINLRQLFPDKQGFRVLDMGKNRLNFYGVSDGVISRDPEKDIDLRIEETLNYFIPLGNRNFAFMATLGENHEFLLHKEGQEELQKVGEFPRWHTFEADELEVPFIYLRSCVAKPSGDRLASFYGYFKRFRIYSGSGELVREVTVENGEKEELRKEVRQRTVYYPYFPIATDDYILILVPSEATEGTMDLQVFDWDGEPVAKYLLGRYVQSIAFDEQAKVLYGCNNESDNTIFVYKLENL